MPNHLENIFGPGSGTFGYSAVYGYGYTFSDQEFQYGGGQGSFLNVVLPQRGDNAEKDARLIEALKKLTHAVNTLNTTSATAADLSALEARVAYVETYPTSGV